MSAKVSRGRQISNKIYAGQTCFMLGSLSTLRQDFHPLEQPPQVVDWEGLRTESSGLSITGNAGSVRIVGGIRSPQCGDRIRGELFDSLLL